jgi:hypothetical protein
VHDDLTSATTAAVPPSTRDYAKLRPVLEELIRWGLPLMTEQHPKDAVRSHWLAWAIELMFTDHETAASASPRST